MPDYNQMIDAAVTSVVKDKNMHVRLPMQNYFARELFLRAISVFEFKGFPETADLEYFTYVLYGYGVVCFVKTNKFGFIPQACTIHGHDVFYRPTHALISNPLLSGINDLKIGEKTEIVTMAPDFNSIMPIVNYYADLLAITSQTMAVNIMNSKLSYIFAASAKGAAESFKKMFDSVVSGDLGVVVDSGLFMTDGTPKWASFTNNLSQNYIASQLLDDMRKLNEQFDTEVGLNNANTGKRERLIVDEVAANNEEIHAKPDIWLQNIRKGFDAVNKLFGTNLSVDYRNKEEVKPSGILQEDAEKRAVGKK